MNTNTIPSPPIVNPTDVLTNVNKSFLSFELSFPMKVILCLVIMLSLHFLYKFLINKYNNTVLESDDEEVLQDLDNIDFENENDDQEYLDENQEYEMEKELVSSINDE